MSVYVTLERTIIFKLEEKPKLEILQYLIDGAILILLSLNLNSQISHFADIASGYPWLRGFFINLHGDLHHSNNDDSLRTRLQNCSFHKKKKEPGSIFD